MGWRWFEPDPIRREPRRALGGFRTREEAIDSAIWNATQKQAETPAIRDVLWKSLEGAGWVVEPELAP